MKSSSIFSEYNTQDSMFLKFIYFCKILYMFQTVLPPIIRNTKLHIQRQAFVRPLLLPAANLDPCIANTFSEYNQQDATFLKLIFFCKTLYIFQTSLG